MCKRQPVPVGLWAVAGSVLARVRRAICVRLGGVIVLRLRLVGGVIGADGDAAELRDSIGLLQRETAGRAEGERSRNVAAALAALLGGAGAVASRVAL
eukprot:5017326-Prorocentrum_lima.AAC.1